MQGAHVGENVYIDTLDMMDLEFLEFGDDCVLGQHSTVLAHTFDKGSIIFSKVYSHPQLRVLSNLSSTSETATIIFKRSI